MKTCRVCYEQIDQRATLCRHCGIAQAGSAVWWARHSGFRLGTALVFTLVFPATWVLVMLVWVPPLFSRGEDFAPYRDQVKVISSQISFNDTEDGPKIYVVGVLRNDSSLAWEKIQLEVQFRDSAGDLVDVARDTESHWGPTVAAGDESGFQINADRHFSKDKYASHQVFVRFAKDSDAWR